MIQSVNKYHIYEILSSDGNFTILFQNISVNTRGVIANGKLFTMTSVRTTMSIS